jgi:hypothetical protein
MEAGAVAPRETYGHGDGGIYPRQMARSWRRPLQVGTGLLLGSFGLALLCKGDAQGGSVVKMQIATSGSSGSERASLQDDLIVGGARLAAGQSRSALPTLLHAPMLQGATDKLHHLAERGVLLLARMTEELEDACSEQEQWGPFCKNRAEEDDYKEKWEAFCTKKLAPTKECDEEQESQNELKKIHAGLVNSCKDMIAHAPDPGPHACLSTSPQNSPECQLAFCKKMVSAEGDSSTSTPATQPPPGPPPPPSPPAPAGSPCDSIADMSQWLECEEKRRSANS